MKPLMKVAWEGELRAPAQAWLEGNTAGPVDSFLVFTPLLGSLSSCSRKVPRLDSISWSCVLRCEHQPHCPGSPSRLFCASFFTTSPMHLLAFIISVGLAQQSANLSYNRHLYSQGYLSCSGWSSPQKYGCLSYSSHNTLFLGPGWVHNTFLNKDENGWGKLQAKGCM